MKKTTAALKLAGLFLGCWAWLAGAQAAPACNPAAGRFVSIQGQVEVGSGAAGGWQAAGLDQALCQGDTVRVGPQSRAALALANDAVLRIDQNTTLRLIDIVGQGKERSWLELVKGALQSFSRKPRLLTVNTPYLNGSIEGTEFVLRVEGEETTLTVFEGTVVAANEQGKVAVPGGGVVAAAKGQAPTPRQVLRPRDAVQWALYYPPVVASGAPNSDVQEAAALLQVGRTDEAAIRLDRALAKNPGDGTALSLKSIVALTANDAPQARALAEKAVGAAPEAATPRIALAYAQQAQFDLAGARASLQKATQLEPANALAWARLAELHASFGDLNAGLAAAERASALEPGLSRTQTVLGFAHLMRVKTADAKLAFDKAIALDQADPMPRLGKGLALIREGQLENGRREMEIAAGLDGNNALIRSYLGKAYFEEKRDDLAASQYATAKGLDPLDPTPYFYDAIQKQTAGRPIEALQDMQQAIDRNDNRGVYRSRLLLDSDASARGVSLARTYSDLGFEDLALVEGWKSVNTDPTNHSAHRFLADSYGSQPRHEIARVSELLQSQLLQPLNASPIQPHLAESSLFMAGSAGPAALSFNEFTQLFNHNGTSMQVGGLTGEQGTYAAEGVFSGITERAAYSFGAYRYLTDGFRQNGDQSDVIRNAFIQYQISPQTSVQLEYRYRSTDKGDLPQRFFADDFFSTERNLSSKEGYRVGLKHDLSESGTLLGSFIYQNLRDSKNNASDLPVSFFGPEQSFGSEFQYLYRRDKLNVTVGLGYFANNGNLQLTTPFALKLGDTDLTHLNSYAYSNWRLKENLTLTLGASYDSLKGETPETDNVKQFNPKLGVTWEPVQGTTIRAAAFRVLKRTLATNQTLEPTQVAGFNQFYDDVNGTDVKNYGLAIDQKLSSTLFFGAEIGKRRLNIPQLDLFTSSVIYLDTEEYSGRTYLFWTPQQWLGLRVGYDYSRIEMASQFSNPSVTTQRLPLGVNIFLPNGFGAAAMATHIHQNGRYERLMTGMPETGKDDFWLMDLALNYRLPRRMGLISVGAKNLFDKEFKYFDTDVNNVFIQPRRQAYLKVTLDLF